MKVLDFEDQHVKDRFRVKEVPKPTVCHAHELMIQVAASGMNCYDGWCRPSASFYPYRSSTNLGYECSGKVVAVGSYADEFKVGDEVCAILQAGGGCAEFIVISAFFVRKIPLGISLVEAAALPQASVITFYALSMMTNVVPGKTILIHEDGCGIDIFAIQYAKYVGCKVITAAGTVEKLQLFKRLGAEVCIDYKGDFCKHVLAETREKGVNYVLDASWRDHFQKNLDCLAMDGCLVVSGSKSKRWVDIDLSHLMRKGISVIGVDLKYITNTEITSIVEDAMDKFWPLIEAGHIKPVVGKTQFTTNSYTNTDHKHK